MCDYIEGWLVDLPPCGEAAGRGQCVSGSSACVPPLRQL